MCKIEERGLLRRILQIRQLMTLPGTYLIDNMINLNAICGAHLRNETSARGEA